MINIFILSVGVILFISSIIILTLVASTSYNDERKLASISFLLLSISILMLAIFYKLPKSNGHWEQVDEKLKEDITLPDSYKIIAMQKVSNSRWLWTEHNGAIKYLVVPK